MQEKKGIYKIKTVGDNLYINQIHRVTLQKYFGKPDNPVAYLGVLLLRLLRYNAYKIQIWVRGGVIV